MAGNGASLSRFRNQSAPTVSTIAVAKPVTTTPQPRHGVLALRGATVSVAVSARAKLPTSAKRSAGVLASARLRAAATCSGTVSRSVRIFGTGSNSRFAAIRHGGWAGVRWFAPEHLVQHAGQRVLVAAAVERFGHSLLRAHVDRSAEHEACLRKRSTAVSGDRARDAEVGDDGAAILQQNVLGLDVAMDDPASMRVRERGRDLVANPERVIYGELALAVEPAAERLALDQRHHVEEQGLRAGVGGAGVVEREDVGVAERRGGLDLPEEPLSAEC